MKPKAVREEKLEAPEKRGWASPGFYWALVVVSALYVALVGITLTLFSAAQPAVYSASAQGLGPALTEAFQSLKSLPLRPSPTPVP